MKFTTIGILSLVLIACTACTQSKAVYTLNPDGSGKAKIQLVQVLTNFMGTPDRGEENLGTKARKRVREILEKSKGVEAWRNLRFEVLQTKDTPYLVLEATVYFRDASKLVFEQQNRFLHPALNRGKDGSAALVIRPGKSDEDGKDADETAPPAAPAEYKDLVEQLERAEERSGLRMLQVMVERYRQEMTFRLPGKVGEVQEMEKVDDRTVRLVFEGRRLARALEQLANKDVKEVLAAVNEMKVKDLKEIYRVLHRLMGVPFQAGVTLEGELETQFDYEAEVAKAREEYDAMLDRLGLK